MKYLILMILGLSTACTAFNPDNAIAYEALPEYAIYWQETENCSGLHGRLNAINWFMIPGRYFIDDRGNKAVGLWRSDGNIYIAEPYIDAPHVIRHEMLHALINHPGHGGLIWDACYNLVSPW